MKKRWEPSKSPSANLRSLGLTASPGGEGKLTGGEAAGGETERMASNVVELYDIPDSDSPKKQRRYPLDLEEERYIVKCMEKWGTDYASMFRDIKTNDMQYTETRLGKLGARYLLLSPEQRRIDDVPERVRKLVPTRDDDDSK